MPESPNKTILFHGMSIVDPLTLLLLSRLSQLEAVIVATAGESAPKSGIELTQRYLQAFGSTDTEVGLGIERTSAAPFSFPQQFLGLAMGAMRIGTGLEKVNNPELPTTGLELARSILEQAQASSVSLVCTCPATDVANLLKTYPELVEKINGITLMSGAIKARGNVDDFGKVKGLEQNPPECNAAADPSALASVLNSGAPVTLVPLDATEVVLDSNFLEMLRQAPDPVGQMLFGYFQRMSGMVKLAGQPGIPAWDPLTAALALHPEIGQTSVQSIGVDPSGRTIPNADGAQINVCTGIFKPEFMDLMQRALGYNTES